MLTQNLNGFLLFFLCTLEINNLDTESEMQKEILSMNNWFGGSICCISELIPFCSFASIYYDIKFHAECGGVLMECNSMYVILIVSNFYWKEKKFRLCLVFMSALQFQIISGKCFVCHCFYTCLMSLMWYTPAWPLSSCNLYARSDTFSFTMHRRYFGANFAEKFLVASDSAKFLL